MYPQKAIQQKRNSPRTRLSTYHKGKREQGAPISYTGEVFSRVGDSLGTVTDQTYHFQVRKLPEEDLITWENMSTTAQFAILNGSPASAPFPTRLTTKENVRLPATLQEVVDYGNTIKSYIVALYEAEQQVKAQIEAGTLTDPDQVEVIYDAALNTILNA